MRPTSYSPVSQTHPTANQASHDTPATTPKRASVFSSNYLSNQPKSSSIFNPNRYLSPSKKKLSIFGTPPTTRTPSRVPLQPVPGTPRIEFQRQPQLPDLPQIPEGKVGYDPELRAILSNHEASLRKLLDRYSRLKLELSHRLNAELAELEHERTNAKCELAVVQKQLAESVEATDKLKNELAAARQKLSKFCDDRRGMELKLSELNSVFTSYQERYQALEARKLLEKQDLVRVVQQTQQEAKLLEEITGLTILAVAHDRLRFKFKLIDMNAYDRVFHIELDLSDFDYRIVSIDPPVSEAPSLLKKLNQTRDFNRFLCDLRQAFKKSMRA